jgi:tRNA A37 threonylcarbamoyladenosine dehydratase
VVPWVQVEACVELWNIENENENGWLEGADWIIDAIDNISTKVSRSLAVHPWYPSIK